MYNYSYLLDPKIANLVSAELQRDCIVVFDECHNIDNACIEAFSLNMNRSALEGARDNLVSLEEKVRELKRMGGQRLQEEYESLKRQMVESKVI